MIKPIVNSYFPFPKEKFSLKEELEFFKNDLIRLKALLAKMDIPFSRKRIDYDNLLWLNKNLDKKNSDNPKFRVTLILIRKLIRKKYLFLHIK